MKKEITFNPKLLVEDFSNLRRKFYLKIGNYESSRLRRDMFSNNSESSLLNSILDNILDVIFHPEMKMLERNRMLKDITILHCNTEYPTPMNDVNLLAMLSIQKEIGVEVGYSDHTEGIEVSIAAVALGAKVIEKHFTLDKNLEGPDHVCSLEPKELKNFILSLRIAEKCIGKNIKKAGIFKKPILKGN